jgi:stage II sporulation protein AA (anti-sigma F factor antagonist)
MPEFSYQVRSDQTVTTVEVSGDVDMAVASRLSEVLDPLITADATVVLDCSGVTFFDSMGLRTAVQGMQQAKDVGATFALIPSTPVTRVLELAGVSGIFTIYDSPSDVPQ